MKTTLNYLKNLPTKAINNQLNGKEVAVLTIITMVLVFTGLYLLAPDSIKH